MNYCKLDSRSELDREYHDHEWGIPLHDDQMQFEYLSMEVMQCGLNWELILKKREVFRQCFDQFDFDQVAEYDDPDVQRILTTENMIRSERKIRAIINNARCFQKIREEYGSFSDYIWSYTEGNTVIYVGHNCGNVPASNHLSETISHDLKGEGFQYLGPVTVYSYLQACGIINDHDFDCPCFIKIANDYPCVIKRDE